MSLHLWPRLAAVLAVLTIWATPAAAVTVPQMPMADEGASTWTILPATGGEPDDRPWFEYIVEPGEEYSDTVAIRNLGTGPLDMAIYAVDGLNSSDGGYAVAAADDPKTDLGSWMQVETTSLHIEPGQTAIVPFTLVVPDDAEPGDHFGGIVASVTMSGGTEGTPVVRENRVGVRMYARVVGMIDPSLTFDHLAGSHDQPINPLRGGDLTVSQTLTNNGNVRLDSARSLEISALFGWWHREITLEPTGDMLPGNALSLTTVLESIPPLGPMTVTAHADPQASAGFPIQIDGVEASVTVWAIPWPQLVALLLLGLLVWQIVAASRRVKRLKARLAIAEASAQDDSRANSEGPAQSQPQETHSEPPTRNEPQEIDSKGAPGDEPQQMNPEPETEDDLGTDKSSSA